MRTGVPCAVFRNEKKPLLVTQEDKILKDIACGKEKEKEKSMNMSFLEDVCEVW